MPCYLVETYLARGLAGERTTRDRRAHTVADELSKEGTPVRFDRSIHVPEDEICFFVFAAPSRRHAALAAERAGLEPIRVVEAVSSENHGDAVRAGRGEGPPATHEADQLRRQERSST